MLVSWSPVTSGAMRLPSEQQTAESQLTCLMFYDHEIPSPSLLFCTTGNILVHTGGTSWQYTAGYVARRVIPVTVPRSNCCMGVALKDCAVRSHHAREQIGLSTSANAIVCWQQSAQRSCAMAGTDARHRPPSSLRHDAPAAAWRQRGRTSLPALDPAVAAATQHLKHGDEEESFFGSAHELLNLLQRMAVFALPLTALVLSEPLLVWCTSLCIGQFSTITELAALGPANIVIGEAGWLAHAWEGPCGQGASHTLQPHFPLGSWFRSTCDAAMHPCGPSAAELP